MVLQEALDGGLLVVGHLEVVAKAASREDDLHASTFGIRNLTKQIKYLIDVDDQSETHLCTGVYLCSSYASDEGASA